MSANDYENKWQGKERSKKVYFSQCHLAHHKSHIMRSLNLGLCHEDPAGNDVKNVNTSNNLNKVSRKFLF
jgi:hypothetical protein